MSQSKSSGSQNKQSAAMSEEDMARSRAGKPEKSSHDAKSDVKAGKDTGAGGGAKQKHRR
jgi:hypothetical protein